MAVTVVHGDVYDADGGGGQRQVGRPGRQRQRLLDRHPLLGADRPDAWRARSSSCAATTTRASAGMSAGGVTDQRHGLGLTSSDLAEAHRRGGLLGPSGRTSERG